MTALVLKTKAEQRVEYISRLKRPLTNKESDDLRRAMHSVYERDRRLGLLAMSRAEELVLLDKLRAEAAQPERYAER